MAQQQQLILAEFIEKVKRESYRKDDRMSRLLEVEYLANSVSSIFP
jgi:hypothetical protein